MTKRWETPIETLLKKEGLSPESIGKVMALIHKKKVDWELAFGRALLAARSTES